MSYVALILALFQAPTSPKPTRPVAKPAALQAPCEARNEGTRALVQGSGTVRTYTFCASKGGR